MVKTERSGDTIRIVDNGMVFYTCAKCGGIAFEGDRNIEHKLGCECLTDAYILSHGIWANQNGGEQEMGEKSVQYGYTGGFFGLLFLLFLGLKLGGVITWSWWWVSAPLWMPFAIFIGILLLALVIALIVYTIKTLVER